MTALITKEDVKLMLPAQIGISTEYDNQLDAICTRVQDIIELYLDFAFDGYGSASTKVVYGKGTPYLQLPPFEPDSVVSVWAEGDTSETPITGWLEEAEGYSLYLTGYDPYGRYGWYPRRYIVTAEWGYGTAPNAVKEVAVELACNIFSESKTGHFSDIVGVQGEGGTVAVGYAGALTKRQKMILDKVKRKYNPVMVA